MTDAEAAIYVAALRWYVGGHAPELPRFDLDYLASKRERMKSALMLARLVSPASEPNTLPRLQLRALALSIVEMEVHSTVPQSPEDNDAGASVFAEALEAAISEPVPAAYLGGLTLSFAFTGLIATASDETIGRWLMSVSKIRHLMHSRWLFNLMHAAIEHLDPRLDAPQPQRRRNLFWFGLFSALLVKLDANRKLIAEGKEDDGTEEMFAASNTIVETSARVGRITDEQYRQLISRPSMP
jgi:hypothetical protein